MSKHLPLVKQPADPYKDLQLYINRGKSLISLGKLLTIKEGYESLGIPQDKWNCGLILENKITHENYSVISNLAKELLELNLHYKDYRSAAADSIIESSFFKEESSLDEFHLSIKLPLANPLQTCTLYPFQHKAAIELYNSIVNENKRGLVLRGNTGDGKTYTLGQVIRWLIDSNFLSKEKTISPYKILYVTAASVVEQTSRDLRDEFGLDLSRDVFVTNYDALRSYVGSVMVDEKIIISQGEEFRIWIWKDYFHPIVVFWDEGHKLKNPTSEQSQIAQAYNNLSSPFTYQIISSATPFSRILACKCFCVSTRKLINIGIGQTELSNKNWTDYSKNIAAPAEPEDYNKAAMKRLLNEFKDYIITFKNVKRKHKGYNHICIISFRTDKERQTYELAWERYLAEKARIHGQGGPNEAFLILVQFLKFRQAAELIRAEYLADAVYESILKDKAAVCACNFKPTIAKIVLTLVNKHGMTRDKISLIWGGDASLAGLKEKFSREEIQDILTRAIQGEDIKRSTIKSIHNQLQSEANGLGEISSELELGIQDRKQRQVEIDKFQSGKSLACLFTFGAGGAGLSLHHKYIYTRQRETYVAPTYNEMEMNQSLGRCPRLTSLSDTYQMIILYKDTIEVKVLGRMLAKNKSLNAVIEHGGGDNLSSNLHTSNNKMLYQADELLALTTPSLEKQEEEEYSEENEEE